MAIPHVFLTRYNLPANRVEQSIFSEEWLRNRTELFRAYTVPSVQQQTQLDQVRWIIYLDQSTPDWLRELIAGLENDALVLPRYLDSPLSEEMIQADIAQAAGNDSGPVITSNLDNDDGLALDYVARMRQAADVDLPSVIYLVNGLIESRGSVYLRRDPSNAFSAVVDDLAATELRHCWSAFHNRLADMMPAVRVLGTPAWLQVVHGVNVSNRVRGELARASDYSNLFAGLLDDLDDPSDLTLTTDRLVGEPMRQAREAIVTKGLPLGRRMIGDHGIETIKVALSRRVSAAPRK